MTQKKNSPIKKMNDFMKSTPGFWVTVGLGAVFMGCVFQEMWNGAAEAEKDSSAITTEERVPENINSEHSLEKNRHDGDETVPAVLEYTLD